VRTIGTHKYTEEEEEGGEVRVVVRDTIFGGGVRN
jgi:hypothetical protein